ncbi:wall-associated receptor kinase-like 14 [Phtheirospermum japonicum]|uniref:Wall-associated receptor kinase-like 14 n=1 Tax=Phtheirospermum japonicum TaxID=374723 RepID=A0A830CUG6_9LAMI|nr:wall-associated receptor kinase-like 14 [Phtheirospermum japonicum]
MKLEFLINLSLFAITALIPISNTSAAAWCNHTCGDQTLHFPFGFSAGCQIRLNCSSNGTILAADLPVQSVDLSTILVSLPATCDRPVAALRRLFTNNFAPTSHNAILLRDCSSNHNTTNCFIPQTMVQTHFELLNCGGGAQNISCYSEKSNRTSFIDLGDLTRGGCRSLFSAISMEPFGNSSSVSLDVQIVRMEWWLRGDCRCSENARCVNVATPLVEGDLAAYRCECLEGFAGDGFRDGGGCRKVARFDVQYMVGYHCRVIETQVCDPSKYLFGRCGGTTRVSVLVGGVAAGAFLIVTLGLVFCFIKKQSKLRTRSKRCQQLYQTTGITVPVYPFKEMEKATDSFSDKRRLGNGAYGTVYAGKLSTDEWVAIKRIKHRDAHSIDQVLNEIHLLSSVSHPNLVRLLGCTVEHEQQILVYEFMPNGTLSQHLQRERGNGLSWPVRLTIAAETAQAISYLHNATRPPIYHRDVKSSNILLDFEYRSKVADFGLSRLGLTESSHVSTAPQGTPGYVDPQYHQHFHLSDKSDVYSFGVVLVEIITGLKVVDFSRPQNEVNLAAFAVDRIGKGRLEEIVDPFLESSLDAWARSAVHKVAELAFRCLAFHSDMRPSMMEVAIELEQIRVSKWIASEMMGCSSSSDLSEKPLNPNSGKYDSLFSSGNSMDTGTDYSPGSGEDTWHSDMSSPSSNSLLNRVNR